MTGEVIPSEEILTGGSEDQPTSSTGEIVTPEVSGTGETVPSEEPEEIIT